MSLKMLAQALIVDHKDTINKIIDVTDYVVGKSGMNVNAA